jgi:hypothetical protein
MFLPFRRLAGAAYVALALTGAAFAQPCCDSGTGFCGAPCCESSCGDCTDPCCNSQRARGWSVFAESEVLFLRYHRADGVRIGAEASETGEFDFEPGTRITLGAMTPDGLGFRGRFFEYDRFQPIEDAGDGLGIDTFNVDLEVFDSMVLGDVWAAEVSAGARYNEFREDMIDINAGDFRSINAEGVGLTAGLEMRRLIGRGHLFARARGAVVQGDKRILNIDGAVVNQALTLLDTTYVVTEIAWGYETNYQLANGATLFSRLGVEWQNWANYSNQFDFVTGEEFFDGPSDIGFAGFTVSAGLTY